MEIWKPIQNYENLYEVSNYGNVRATHREFIGKDGKLKIYHAKLLKSDTSVLKRGYHRVTLSKNGITQRFQVHRLVAEAFIPNPMNKPFVNHIDNNGLNNNVNNLEWCTHSENMVHAQKQGRLFNSQSTGGTIAGKLAKQRSLNEANSLIGTQKHQWLVTAVAPSRHNKTSLYLQCTGCNRTFQYTMEYFKNSIGTGCPKCRKRKSS